VIKNLMQRSGWRFAILSLAMAMMLVGAWVIYRLVAGGQASGDQTAQFLAAHWAQPLAAQGEPPPGFSPLEDSLSPEACGTCHASQYADWRTSLHSHTMGAGILWQFRVLSQEESNRCLRCHAPLAEQKALTALQHKWTNAPRSAPPSYVDGDLHLRGLICAACHVRRHQRFGPPSNIQNAVKETHQAHGGFVAEKAFQDSRFCSTCHQFPPQGRSLAGKLIENTYEEWRTSPAAEKGLACQNCHMPGKKHLWRGIHDREMVAKGVERQLEVKRVDGTHLSIKAIIRTSGVGHFFPTYIVPKVTVSVHMRNSAGTREIARHEIGRVVGVDMDQELSDTRIPPGGEAVVAAEVEVPTGVNYIEMRMAVTPAEHYARMYQSMLDRNPDMDAATQSLLRSALREALATAYRLDDLVVVAPDKLGETKHVVAN